MTPENWLRLSTLVGEAVKQPKEHQFAYLEAGCRGDVALLREARLWLAAYSDSTDSSLLPDWSAAGANIEASGSVQTLHLGQGELVAGRFRVENLLGVGGMGEVYRVMDETLKSVMALKLIRPDLRRGQQSIARFRREILTARRVSHPNVVRVFEAGIFNVNDHDTLFFTMELIEGRNLAEALKEERIVSPPACRKLVGEMAAGLRALHDAGIVHRDFKPSNVIVSGSLENPDRVVLTDFGLAVAISGSGRVEKPVTETGLVLGTPRYMAPEQILNQPVTPATDLYALGLTIFEMLFGRPLIDPQASIPQLLERFAKAPELPANSHLLPAGWSRALLAALSPNPVERPQRVDDLLRILDSVSEPLVVPIYKPSTSTRRALLSGTAVALAATAATMWSSYTGRGLNSTRSGIDPRALEAYQRGRYLWSQRETGFLEKAEAEFLKAVEIEPKFGLGYSGIADCHSIRADYGQSVSSEEIAKALEAARRAVQLSSDRAEPHASLALALDLDPWAREKPDEEFRRAIALDPSCEQALQWYGAHLARSGSFSEGGSLIKKARDLNPVSIPSNIQLAWHHYFADATDDAIAVAGRTLELKPDYAPGHALLALCYLRQGNLNRALELALELPGERFPNSLPLKGYLLGKGGDFESARRFMTTLQSLRGQQPRRWAFQIACLYASSGEVAPAVRWLQIAYDEQEAVLNYLAVWPYFDEIHAEPSVSVFRKRLDLALSKRVA